MTKEDAEIVKEYINKRVHVDPDTGCWIWQRSKYLKTYGKASFKGKAVVAHRLSWTAYNGGSLKGIGENGKRMIIRHICSNTLCMNPLHLELGSDVDSAEGRRKAGVTGGSKNGQAKLTEDQVLEIIASKGHMTNLERARRFNVTKGTIAKIDSGRAWSHLTRPNTVKHHVPRRRETRTLEWTLELMDMAYEKVKENCKWEVEANVYTGTPCFVWKTDKLLHFGRGQICFRGKQYSAQLITCMYKERRVRPQGIIVRHRCGNGVCCNPEHVVFDTYQANAHDRVKMGGAGKLSEDDVREIRSQHAAGITPTELMRQFDITRSTVHMIIKRRTWQNIV
jgi:DNA-binding CsgD family transcriptional regulator